MRFVFDVAGDTQVNRKILRVAQHAGDARAVFSSIADYMMGETARQFDTEGGYASGGWRPLKPATVLAKARHRPPLDPRILHATLALERSLTRRGDPNQLLEIGRDELAFGSRLPYADAHQRPKPTSSLPQRRPVEFTESARRTIVKKLQRYILTGEVG